MAAKPKLTPEEWDAVRKRWEGDARQGFSWIVAEMALPVSAPGVRKTALREEWAKAETKPSQSSKVSKVSQVGLTMVSETIETNKPETFVDPLAAFPEIAEKLSQRERVFVSEYVKDFNGARSAKEAGYSAKTAKEIAFELLTRPHVKTAIAELNADRLDRLSIETDDLLRTWYMVANTDPGELTQYRRVACRHCWGSNYAYQYTPAEFSKAKLKHAEKRAEMIAKTHGAVDIGEFDGVEGDWYRKDRGPNPECPECFGEGRGETFFADTRKLSEDGKRLYDGVKETRDGIEIKTLSREKAAENLARCMGLYDGKGGAEESEELDVAELGRRYDDTMRQARERQAAILRERAALGMDVEGEYSDEGVA